MQTVLVISNQTTWNVKVSNAYMDNDYNSDACYNVTIGPGLQKACFGTTALMPSCSSTNGGGTIWADGVSSGYKLAPFVYSSC
jgi:hypothetical protein